MANEIIDYSDTYVDTVAPSAQEIGSYYTNVTKKNKNSNDPLGYVWGKYQQEQDEYFFKNPYINERTFLEEKAPEFSYYSKLPAQGSFEAFIAGAISDPNKQITPTEVDQAVKYAIDNNMYKGDISANPLAPFNFAKNLYQEYTKAKKDFADYDYNWSRAAPLAQMGIPDPSKNYNPTAFKEYKTWEDNKIKRIASTLGKEFTPVLKEKVEAILRSRAVEKYRAAGRTPYKDAIVKLEAAK